MRVLPFLLLLLLPVQVLAQPGKAQFEDRSTMVNDSVRKVERVDLKKGRVIDRRYYVGTRPVGVWQEFNAKGELSVERDFDKLRYGKLPEVRPEFVPAPITAETDTFAVVETMPRFPGGEAELFKFIAQHVKYPGAAQDEGITGTVYLVGIVDEEGVWRTMTVLRSAHPLLDYEAWRVCDLMPKWSPGTQNNKAVKVQYNLPIRFMLR